MAPGCSRSVAVFLMLFRSTFDYFWNCSMETRSNPLGMTLFVVYLVIYTGFVLINAMAPQLMERTPVAGLNLAILYGFALIIIAFVLSLLYGFLASRQDSRSGQSDDGGAA